MADNPDVHAKDWLSIIETMHAMSLKLPVDWDEKPEFFFEYIKRLVDTVMGLRGVISAEGLAAIVGAGSLLVAQSVKRCEAQELADDLFRRLRDRGGDCG